MMRRIILHGELKEKLGDRADLFMFGGVLATLDEYEKRAMGEACLCLDGLVRRFGEVIGKQNDIEFVEYH